MIERDPAESPRHLTYVIARQSVRIKSFLTSQEPDQAWFRALREFLGADRAFSEGALSAGNARDDVSRAG